MRVSFDADVVRRRRKAFKEALRQLQERMTKATVLPLAFASRERPGHPPLADYDAFFNKGREDRGRRSDELRKTLQDEQGWDPQTASCMASFRKVVSLLKVGLDFVEELQAMLPPLEQRGLHREWARAEAQLAEGQCGLALTLGAPSPDAARDLQTRAQGAFDRAKVAADLLGGLHERARRFPSGGPFQINGSLDIASIISAGVGNRPTSVREAAELVRVAFRGVPGISALDDAHAFLLLPAITMGASVIDRDLLIRRCTLLREVLEKAKGTVWINEPELLVTHVQRGVESLLGEIERLGWDVVTKAPREHNLRSLLDAYEKWTEGALRDLGGVVVIAERAMKGGPNGSYESAVCNAIQAGDVQTELVALGSLFRGAVDLLFRNAPAHARFSVTDTGVEVIQERSEAGRVVATRIERVSDREFGEVVVALAELLVALQLSVLPWLWSQPTPEVAAAEARVVPTANEQRRVVLAIAGLIGIASPRVSLEADTVMIGGATSIGQRDGRTELQVLTVIPAAFGAFTDAGEVRLELEPLLPVVFRRPEIGDLSDEPDQQALVGLFNAKWLIESGIGLNAADQATWVTVPLTRVAFHSAELCSQRSSLVGVREALAPLRSTLRRLDEVLPHERSRLTKAAIRESHALCRAVAGLMESKSGVRRSRTALGYGHEAADAVANIVSIQAEAMKVPDGG
jgi:hypothetical protein